MDFSIERFPACQVAKTSLLVTEYETLIWFGVLSEEAIATPLVHDAPVALVLMCQSTLLEESM